MKVTVCQLPGDGAALEEAWDGLTEHVRAEASDLVLLPEMPFHRWLPRTREPSGPAWLEAVEAHRRWTARLPEIAPAAVAATRPALRGERRRNEGFVWTPDAGERTVHAKRHLPDEDGFWEATWYEPGPAEFSTARCAGGRIGFLICTELWFPEHGRGYAREGIHLLLSPRATPAYSAGKWLAAGRTAAVVAGAFGLSSNRSGEPGGETDFEWAGRGWVVGPDGEVLGVTSDEEPWLTREVDPGVAEAAKETYPRYVEG